MSFFRRKIFTRNISVTLLLYYTILTRFNEKHNKQLVTYLLTYLLVLFVPTGTKGLNFTIVEVSIAVKFLLQRQGC
jgi:putative effector of murein hydrolase LrgA (UPF0299 family)